MSVQASPISESPSAPSIDLRCRSRQSDTRIENLDGLRGLAAMAVVLFHYSTQYDQLYGRAEPLGWGVTKGGFGVDLFFILSGFVILLTLERTETIRQFIVARFCRLYPVFWCGVIATFAVVSSCGLPGQETSWMDFFVNFTMIQEVFDAKSVDGAYWSLQAELFFYMNALVLYFSGAFRRFNITMLGWLGLCAIVSLIVGYSDPGPLVAGLQKLQTMLSLEYIPLFGMGICLHEMYRGRTSRKAIVGLLVACFAVQWLRADGFKAIVDLALAGVVVTAIFRPVPGLASRPLLFLGAVSYPLYIVHQNIGYVIIRKLEGTFCSGNIAVVLAIAVALVLAFLITKYVDLPAQQRLRPLLKEVRFRSAWISAQSRRNKRLDTAFDQAGNREL